MTARVVSISMTLKKTGPFTVSSFKVSPFTQSNKNQKQIITPAKLKKNSNTYPPPSSISSSSILNISGSLASSVSRNIGNTKPVVTSGGGSLEKKRGGIVRLIKTLINFNKGGSRVNKHGKMLSD